MSQIRVDIVLEPGRPKLDSSLCLLFNVSFSFSICNVGMMMLIYGATIQIKWYILYKEFRALHCEHSTMMIHILKDNNKNKNT